MRILVILAALLLGGCSQKSPSGLDPCATTSSPDVPRDFLAQAGPASVTLTWTNPGGTFAGVRLLRRIGQYPTSPDDSLAVLVLEGGGAVAVDTALVLGGSYQYALWSFDGCSPRRFSATADTTRASPFQPGPPPSPAILVATAGAHSLALEWVNLPGPTFEATVIRRDTTGFPATVADGEPVFEGTATAFTDTALTPLRTYFYSAFTRDVFGQVSATPAQANGAPDWLYQDFVIPPLAIGDRFPSQRCGGDCDFVDRGPVVTLSVAWRRQERTFWIEVTAFRAVEAALPGSDGTCIQKVSTDPWTSLPYTIVSPEPWVFHSYPGLSQLTENFQYTDVTILHDVLTGFHFLNYAIVVGSTFGLDVCGQTEEDTHLHYLVTREVTARFRR